MKLHPLENIAKRHFGVTDSLEETGYVLSDGTFLDLTGRHMAEGYERKGDRFVPKKRRPDYLAFQRSIDHRQLPPEILEAAGTGEGSLAMHFFLRETGALRLMPGAGFLVTRMPTVEAVARVIREWHHAFGDEPLYVDVVYPDSRPDRSSRVINPDDVRDSQEFAEPTIEGVMEFLESKFGGASMGAARGRKAPAGNKTYWRPGETAYFEYHCCQSHDSADAEIWYRSQQPVQVLSIVDPGGGRTMMKRIEYNIPRMYRVRFADGLEWTVFEDELLTAPRYYDQAYAPGERPS